MPLSVDQVLNYRYRIRKLLGKGGFGAVYQAWDIVLDRACAIKENLSPSEGAQRQFLREARLLANLDHPNLPRVTDHFILEGASYLVMDYVEGQDLDEIIHTQGAPIPEAKALDWISQVCDALEYLHNQDPPVIHRDIKPANIKITPQGKVKLVDFGIAKTYDPERDTTVGARGLSPGYSPQEQYGNAATDARSDIYALGATLYHILTGHRPVESVQRNLGTHLTPPHHLNPSISPHVETAILNAMQMLPDNRYQTAAEFKAALSHSPDHMVSASKSNHFQASAATRSASPKLKEIPSSKPQSGKLPSRLASSELQGAQPSRPSSQPAAPATKWPLWGILGSVGIVGLCSLFVFILWLLGTFTYPSTLPTATNSPIAMLAIISSPTSSPSPLATSPRPTRAPTLTPTMDIISADEPTQASIPSFKACLVTDAGGIDDRSFNAVAWKGVQDAMEKIPVNGVYLESRSQADYEKNISSLVQERCNLIITVGYLLGDATQNASNRYTDQHFAIVDFLYDPDLPNVRSSTFQIEQATFLAGYLAAGMSQTGKVAVFGGLQIPPVTAFMDGYYQGVEYYNRIHNSRVQVIGWDPTDQTGLFTGNFENTDDGRSLGLALLEEGADIIMPVAGAVGAGTLSALKERQRGLLIGVDTDWSTKYPQDSEYILASAVKRMDVFVYETIGLALEGQFTGGHYIGNLENNGVELVYGYSWRNKIPTVLQDEISSLVNQIISGTIRTTP